MKRKSTTEKIDKYLNSNIKAKMNIYSIYCKENDDETLIYKNGIFITKSTELSFSSRKKNLDEKDI